MTSSLGLIVNPIAGMGGAVGLHGTDGTILLEEARRRGAAPVTANRAKRALERIDASSVRFVTVAGCMGADVLSGLGIEAEQLPLVLNDVTTGNDTRSAARLLGDVGCDLILFVGGDGTAHDVVRGVGMNVPVLGVPSGVKMRSGVFAASPETAGNIANEFLSGGCRSVASADLLDVTAGGKAEQFLGVATVPQVRGGRVTGAKVSKTVGSKTEFDALCGAVAQELEEGTLYLFGPGSTTMQVQRYLGITGAPLGVDAVVNGQMVGTDLSEDEIIAVMALYHKKKLILGVVGGQGFLLGRGNQQIGARVLNQLEPEDILIVSSAAKLFALEPSVLWVDVDGARPRLCASYQRVRVAPHRSVVMRIAVPS